MPRRGAVNTAPPSTHLPSHNKNCFGFVAVGRDLNLFSRLICLCPCPYPCPCPLVGLLWIWACHKVRNLTKSVGNSVFYASLVIWGCLWGAKMCKKPYVLQVFCDLWSNLDDPWNHRPTRSKTRSTSSDGLLRNLLEIGLGATFRLILGGLGSEKSHGNRVFCECFGICGTILTQLGTLVARWF